MWTDKTIEAACENVRRHFGEGRVFEICEAGKKENHGFILRLRDNDFVAEVTSDGTGALHIRAYNGRSLSDLIRAVADGRDAHLDGGTADQALMCIDHRGRVWFDAAKTWPSAGETVLCELGNGEKLWCRFNGKNYITVYNLSTVSNDSVVEPSAWAWPSDHDKEAGRF